jgi:hypothetical protein
MSKICSREWSLDGARCQLWDVVVLAFIDGESTFRFDFHDA